MLGTIIVDHEKRLLKLIVDRVYLSSRIERIKVSGRNRAIVLEGNRPLLRSKGLKHRRIDWRLIEGSLRSLSLHDSIIEQVDRLVRSLEK